MGKSEKSGFFMKFMKVQANFDISSSKGMGKNLEFIGKSENSGFFRNHCSQ